LGSRLARAFNGVPVTAIGEHEPAFVRTTCANSISAPLRAAAHFCNSVLRNLQTREDDATFRYALWKASREIAAAPQIKMLKND
jgi:hypothetical protein